MRNNGKTASKANTSPFRLITIDKAPEDVQKAYGAVLQAEATLAKAQLAFQAVYLASPRAKAAALTSDNSKFSYNFGKGVHAQRKCVSVAPIGHGSADSEEDSGF